MPTPRAEAVLRAIALGAVQGPSELAPVSSSAHVATLRALLDDGRRREPLETAAARAKALEVALHGGGAVALTLTLQRRLRREYARLPGPAARRAAAIAASLAPPSLVGHRFERSIEQRLGGRRSIAAGLIAGAGAIALADARPGMRTLEQVELRDGLALGFAQAAALAPGVSRHGATLAAARARGFTRADADTLSWLTGLPAILAAVTLKTYRLARGGRERGTGAELLAGTGAAFCSTLLAARAQGQAAGGRERPLLRYSVYRVALALLLLRRPRRRP